MFALLTILTVLIAAMFVGLFASTLRELRHEAVDIDPTVVGRNSR
ncbi:hypothetical protein QTL95_17745 [Rhizobium sp. S152]|nr:hypothetical protein [Rhizobium sp. S152]MDM9627741.1 hypothetical protein [Rhizobium sp. S152]